MVVKNHAVAEQVVDATNFIAYSRASKEALRSANLLKSLDINALITGEEGVGKATLAKYILNAPMVDGGENIDTILSLIVEHKKIIILNFDRIMHTDILHQALQKNKTKIVATSSKDIFHKISDKFFSLSINLPPLRKREEDIYPLAKKFLKEAKRDFGLDNIDINIKKDRLDISRNCYSLRVSIYKLIIEELTKEEDIMQMLQDILYKRLGSNNDYRNNLYIYEIPLIKAGFLKFKSQLKMAEKFGINRNTLRKKINEYQLQER